MNPQRLRILESGTQNGCWSPDSERIAVREQVLEIWAQTVLERSQRVMQGACALLPEPPPPPPPVAPPRDPDLLYDDPVVNAAAFPRTLAESCDVALQLVSAMRGARPVATLSLSLHSS